MRQEGVYRPDPGWSRGLALLETLCNRRLRKMSTLVIVLVLVFLLGGGGWGYSRYRR